jgi:hypothetical protein
VQSFQGNPILCDGACRSQAIDGIDVRPSAAPADTSAGREPPSGASLARCWPYLRVHLPQPIPTPVNGPPQRSPDRDQQPHLYRADRDDVMADFSIRMNNRLQFSSCDAPHQPTTKVHEETLAVELRGDLLTITAVRKGCELGSRIYAQRTLDIPGISKFVILSELPSHIQDGSFFPAYGSVTISPADGGARRRLRAVGTDTNTGRCHGWIFDAVET